GRRRGGGEGEKGGGSAMKAEISEVSIETMSITSSEIDISSYPSDLGTEPILFDKQWIADMVTVIDLKMALSLHESGQKLMDLFVVRLIINNGNQYSTLAQFLQAGVSQETQLAVKSDVNSLLEFARRTTERVGNGGRLLFIQSSPDDSSALLLATFVTYRLGKDTVDTR
ncbi:hypothetical protein PENTCL1PPCAC_18987, partial [Pristionchus entomophagus]